MDDKKLEALIVLLDDADPEVVEVVEKELLTLGDYAIDYLEKKKLQSDFKDRIENVIQKIVSKTQTQNLLNWRLNGGSDLLQGWLLVSHFENHDFKDEIIKNTINKLVNKIWLATNAYMNLSEKLRLISQTLFQIELFTGDIDKINDPQYFLLIRFYRLKLVALWAFLHCIFTFAKN